MTNAMQYPTIEIFYTSTNKNLSLVFMVHASCFTYASTKFLSKSWCNPPKERNELSLFVDVIHKHRAALQYNCTSMDMHLSTQRQIKITDNKQQTYQQAEHSGTLMERCRGNVTFRRRNYFFPVCVVFTVIHPGHVVCSQSGPDQMLGGSRCIESLHISYFRISGQKRDVV